jgi:subtilisin family serine protease
MINRLQYNDISDLVNYQDYEFVPGEFIVKFKEVPISSLSVDYLNEKYQVKAIENIFKNNKDTTLDNIYSFYVSEDADILSIVEDYNSLDNVEYAEPNYIGHILGVPNDEYFPIQWGLENTGQIIFGDKAGSSGADICATEAWDIETGSPDVVVAIIDTGVDYTHPDLSANIWVNEDELPGNDVDDDGNGYVDDYYGYDVHDLDGDPIDERGHGTHCAGIAAGVANNEIGIAGVAWNCKVMSVKIFGGEGGGSFKKFAEGLIYAADNGANIFSMSFGASVDSRYLRDAVNYSYDTGCVLVAACGNSDISDKMYPAGYDSVIAVSAINQNNERCDRDDWDPDGNNPYSVGSNYGYWVDVTAPGNLVYSTMPIYHVTMNEFDNENTGQNYSQNYDYLGGTSMACPHVAGLVALLLSQDPNLSQEEVREIIRANVDPYISEYYMGTGRINAYKALTRYNIQPEIPVTITGKTSGRPGREYSFSTSASDSDDDELYYFWDWGDGNYSEWLGPYASGEECEASYTWQQEANFSIKVKVKDGKGGESYWSEEFIFSTPRNKIFSAPFLEFLENHPRLFSLLRQLLKL